VLASAKLSETARGGASRVGHPCPERAADPLNRTRIDPKPLSDLAYARPSGSRQSLPDPLFQLGGYPRPSESLSLALGPRQAGTDPFLNHGALKLGKHAHHLKHGFTRRRRGVEALLS
jgi:hypothetical protein